MALDNSFDRYVLSRSDSHSHNHDQPSQIGRAYLAAFVGTVLGVSAGMFLATIAMPSIAETNVQPTAMLTAKAEASPSIAPAAPVLATKQSQPAATVEKTSVSHVISAGKVKSARIMPQLRLASAQRTATPRVQEAVMHSSAPTFSVSPSSNMVAAAYSPEIQAHTDITNQPSPARAPAFAVAGALRVADLDVQAKTIQTIDGRVFSLDGGNMTSLATLAGSQFSMYYQCEQGGSCVLRGPGATVINARRI